jgi:Sodium/hydrogen exchanger family
MMRAMRNAGRPYVIDKLSILVGPVADGSTGTATLFDVEKRTPARSLKLISVEKLAGGIVSGFGTRFAADARVRDRDRAAPRRRGTAAVARRIATPYPALVAVAGAALAPFPGMPSLVLDPELALTLFVAPVLLDAAFDASQRDLRRNWRVVVGLALGAVVLTVLVVAVVAHALVPGLPWAAAIALGAIVAPPDAAAATAVLKQLRPPNRLLNDAASAHRSPRRAR